MHTSKIWARELRARQQGLEDSGWMNDWPDQTLNIPNSEMNQASKHSKQTIFASQVLGNICSTVLRYTSIIPPLCDGTIIACGCCSLRKTIKGREFFFFFNKISFVGHWTVIAKFQVLSCQDVQSWRTRE